MKSTSIIFLALWLGACAAKEDGALIEAQNVKMEQIIVPVVQGKSTTVAQIKMELENAVVLSGVNLDLQGAVKMDAISLWDHSGDSEKPKKIGDFQGDGKDWVFEGEYRLQKGSYKMDLVVIVSEEVDLKEKFELEVTSITLGGEKIKPTGPGRSYPCLAGRQAYRLAKLLRDGGDDGVHTYRIPGLATSLEGSLLAVYDVRHDKGSDLQGDIDVGLSRSTDGGQTWEPMKIIMDMGEWGGLPENENGIGDPAILVDDLTGTIWVVGLWMHGKPGLAAWNSSGPGLNPEETGQLMLVKSEDEGNTWSKPINITQPMKDPGWNLFFNGPGKGITMEDGTLVFAAQYKDADQIPFSTIIYSKDRGQTWEVGSGAKSNTTEAQVVELDEGRLMLNMRDNRGGSRSVAVTEDMGESWIEHASSRKALMEPVCMASIIDYKDNVLFFSNPATTDGRYNITIKASLDNGNSWPETRQVLLDQERGPGYSCLTIVEENQLGIIYESSQAHLVFQLVEIQELMGEE